MQLHYNTGNYVDEYECQDIDKQQRETETSVYSEN